MEFVCLVSNDLISNILYLFQSSWELGLILLKSDMNINKIFRRFIIFDNRLLRYILGFIERYSTVPTLPLKTSYKEASLSNKNAYTSCTTKCLYTKVERRIILNTWLYSFPIPDRMCLNDFFVIFVFCNLSFRSDIHLFRQNWLFVKAHTCVIIKRSWRSSSWSLLFCEKVELACRMSTHIFE